MSSSSTFFVKFISSAPVCRQRASNFIIRCRHAFFASHFGERPPVCNKQCDFCSDFKALEKRKTLHVATKAKNVRVRVAEEEELYLLDAEDLYEGGKAGMKR